MTETLPVYVISVAARLLDVHPQTLRNYERAGFLRPTRTEGKRRLYSASDIERLRHLIGTVEQYGLNLTGLKMLLTLQRELRDLETRLDASLSRSDSAELQVRVRQMLELLGGDTSQLAEDEAGEDDGEES
ncbi:MAG: MerR family transcriptional regulator [Thermomicrobiales bacterium]